MFSWLPLGQLGVCKAFLKIPFLLRENYTLNKLLFSLSVIEDSPAALQSLVATCWNEQCCTDYEKHQNPFEPLSGYYKDIHKTEYHLSIDSLFKY